MNALETKHFQQVTEVSVMGPGSDRRVRLTEPSGVVADRPERAPETHPLRLPHPPIRDAGVDEHDRFALAGRLPGEPSGRAALDDPRPHRASMTGDRHRIAYRGTPDTV